MIHVNAIDLELFQIRIDSLPDKDIRITKALESFQQDAYQAGLKDGEIKGLERAVEIDADGVHKRFTSESTTSRIQSEIQKRKEGQ